MGTGTGRGACLGLAPALPEGDAEALPLAPGLAGGEGDSDGGAEAVADVEDEGLRLPDALPSGPSPSARPIAVCTPPPSVAGANAAV